MKAPAIALSALGWLTSLCPIAGQAAVPDLTALIANGDDVSRRRELVPYIKSLRPGEVSLALKQAIDGHGAGREETIDALSGRWVELDPAAAIAFSRQTTDRASGNAIRNAYYGAWASHDAEGALQAARHANAPERATATWAVAYRLGATDPRRAHDLTKARQAANRSGLDYFIFWHWAKKDLPEATRTLLQDARFAGFSYPCQTEISAIIDRLYDDDPQAAAAWANQLPAGKLQDQATERLFSQWKKADRDAVERWLKSAPESDQIKNALLNLPKANEYLPPPAKIDPAFAAKAAQLDKILAESNFWLELQALLPFVDGLTAAEFPQAFEHIRNIPMENRNTVIDLLVSRWAEIDLAGAIRAIPVAETIHDSEFSDRFLANVYAAWSQRDSQAAYAAATRDRPGVGKTYGNYDVLRAIFAELARQDPVKAHAAFLELNNANSHMLVIPIFAEWAAHDLPGATAALTKERYSDGAIQGIVIGLMRRGPATALAWAETLSDPSLRNRALRDIASRWPDNPEAAMAWLVQYPEFEGKDDALSSVAVAWVVRNPSEAIRHALGLADGKEKEQLLFWGMAQSAYDNAEAAQRAAQQLPDKAARKKALNTVLIFWSGYDPLAAADFLSSIKSEATPENLAAITSDLSDRDPVSTVRWLDTFPASLDKSPAIGKLAENWQRIDAQAASTWVNQLPSGPLYDAGANGIATALREDPPQALKWARSIASPEVRHGAVYQAFNNATNFRYTGIQVRQQIQDATELTEAEKTTLVARLPAPIIFKFPQPAEKQNSPANN